MQKEKEIINKIRRNKMKNFWKRENPSCEKRNEKKFWGRKEKIERTDINSLIPSM